MYRNRLCIITISLFVACLIFTDRTNAQNHIHPYPENPYYWQYNGEPLFLIGGTWQDNLFNHPTNLEQHLDLLKSVGGNYVRNVMSHRNIGNVFAWMQDDEGLYDLDHFNEEYWDRLENFLELTFERDIIVQLELWATWDLYVDHQSLGGWSLHPFNPENNVNYTLLESGLPDEITYTPSTNPTEHSFFRSVPNLGNNELLLGFQKAYVDKVLSYTLQYPHVLYTMNNETGEPVEWGDYWADYVRERANKKGVHIEVTDMRRNEDIRSEDHYHILNNPDRYSFVDISQNNAGTGLGREHYENILYVRDFIAENPRPINNTKNYGAFRHGEEESVARMGRILFAGAASARFHRPHPLEDPSDHFAKTEFGLGLSPRAQNIILSISKLTNEIEIERTEPKPDLVNTDNEVYLLAEPGLQYAAYFPYGGKATFKMGKPGETYQYKWINLDVGVWSLFGSLSVNNDNEVEVGAPGTGHWIIVLKK